MARPTPAQIADGVAATWNGSSIRTDVGVDATRKNRPRFNLKEYAAGEVKVTAAIRSVEASPITRGTPQFETVVDLAIQKKIPIATEDAEIDVLNEYVFRTVEFMQGATVVEGAVVSRAQVDPLFSVDHLDENQLYTGIVSLTIKTIG